jgi:aminomethyltransferase
MGNTSAPKTLIIPHVDLGARMAPFAGWMMPLWYTFATDEHLAVRQNAGVFDVSHMGVFELKGKNATSLLEEITPTLFSQKKEMTITYTLLMAEKGGILDDWLVYKWNDNRYWVIANASNRERVSEELQTKPLELAILALQGPKSPTYFAPLPKKMTFLTTPQGYVVSGSGYTGEAGVEIFLPLNQAKELFFSLVKQGVTPCGLAARDTLRLEKGYALYGHELTENIAPEESVASWVLHPRETPYRGQGKLKPYRKPVSFLLEQGIPRETFLLYSNQKEVGVVTSGTFSPSLKKGIGLGLVTENPTHVLIRDKYFPLKLTPLPFV